MKISYNWLKEYLNLDMTAEKTADLLTDIGLEVESIDLHEEVRGGLKGVVIGEVIQKRKHPNADRLALAVVDIGLENPLNIVCGAPNLSEGQKVPVATIGTWLYDGDNKFKIKKGKIRGEVSEGMICGEDEIGLGEDTDGIMVLDKDAKSGMPAAEFFKLQSDVIFDIGLTPNRSDAMSHYGVARDLKAVLNRNGGNFKICVRNVDAFVDPIEETQKISVNVSNNHLCPRYSGISISDVKVKESPDWLKKKLLSIGQTPINNIVDITNYILHDTGQPLHAFDIQKIKGGVINVDTVKSKTKIITLDEEERELSSEDLIISNDNHPMCIAGVFGGLNSGVSMDTKNVFIESALFDPISIRKTAKRHNLNTESSFRFERGVDPNMVIYALKRAALLIVEIAEGKISSPIIDHYPKPYSYKDVDLYYEKMDRLIGQSIDREMVKSILNDLEIKITDESNNYIKLSVPPFRADVNRDVDVIEEILRIYGYNNIDLPDTIRTPYIDKDISDNELQKHIVSNFLSNNGYNEVINNSLIKKEYLELINTEYKHVEMLNPLSADLSIMRHNMLFGVLENINHNQNRQNADLSLYEFGKTYIKQELEYNEYTHLFIAITGKKNEENWNKSARKVDFYDIKEIVEAILKKLNFNRLSSSDSDIEYIDQGISCQFKKKNVVNFGSVSKKLLDKFDIKSDVYIADFNWDVISKRKIEAATYSPYSKFPSVRRDLSLLLEKDIEFTQIKKIALQIGGSELDSVNLFDVYEGKNISSDKKSYSISLTFSDATKTLTDRFVDGVIDKLIKKLKQEIEVEIRS